MSEHSESVEELPAAGDRQPQWPKLAVMNFGPIAEGEVELRPLTVFAGPSNTGKSWLATLIYAMALHAKTGYGLRAFRSSIKLTGDNLLENFPENPVAWLQNLQENGVVHLTDDDKHVLTSVMERGQNVLKKELLRCFGLADASHIVRDGNAGTTSINFLSAGQPDAFAIRRRLTVTKNGDFSLGIDVMTDEHRPPFTERFMDMLEFLPDADDEHDKIRSRYRRADLLRLLCRNRRYASVYYLPADRGGVMHSHRAVVGALVQSASRAGLTRRPIPVLSGVLSDFLQRLTEFAGHSPKHLPPGYPTADPAGSLEREILGGQIRAIKSDVDYPIFTYRPYGSERDLSLTIVSSMVSELAPVALYLRHYVEEGDLLILEEPEAHLHPALQVRLVREIAGWVRYGVRVLITTHSEWVIEAIANMVAADETGKADGLPRRNVGVWRFDLSDKGKAAGSRIREVKWDPDEGGYPVGFGAVASELMNDWADLLEDAE